MEGGISVLRSEVEGGTLNPKSGMLGWGAGPGAGFVLVVVREGGGGGSGTCGGIGGGGGGAEVAEEEEEKEEEEEEEESGTSFCLLEGGSSLLEAVLCVGEGEGEGEGGRREEGENVLEKGRWGKEEGGQTIYLQWFASLLRIVLPKMKRGQW